MIKKETGSAHILKLTLKKMRPKRCEVLREKKLQSKIPVIKWKRSGRQTKCVKTTMDKRSQTERRMRITEQ